MKIPEANCKGTKICMGSLTLGCGFVLFCICGQNINTHFIVSTTRHTCAEGRVVYLITVLTTTTAQSLYTMCCTATALQHTALEKY